VIKLLYLDNSATTPILPEVKEVMLPYLYEEYGNPSSKYYSLAINAKQAVVNARKNVAKLLGCDETEIIFTSGSTESNNMVLKGVAETYCGKGKHIITSKVEHPSVIETCKYLESRGFRITFMDVDRFGRISLEQLEKNISNETILVSLLWGNNELGSLNDIEAVSKICFDKNVYFHTDATQVVGKINIDLSALPGITFLSCSAHKFHGPKGIGVAFIRKDEYGIHTKITPLLHGGGQEYDLRSGTLPVHNIVGMGKAAEITFENLNSNIKKLTELEDYLTNLLVTKFSKQIIFNSDKDNKIPGILNVQFIGINNEVLLKSISPLIAASTGSACSSSKPSHVLSAIGLSIEEIRSSVRFSMSHLINKEDLDIFKEL